MFIWKDGELEDFFLSRSEKFFKICEILNFGVKKKSENKIFKIDLIEINDKSN